MANRSADEARPEGHRSGMAWKAALVVLLLLIAGSLLWMRGGAERTTFPMKEVLTPAGLMENAVPQQCDHTAATEVKRYPRFRSAKPLYGKFFIHSADRKNKPEAGYFFAIDESRGTDSGYDTLYLDANHNVDLTDDKPAESHAPPPIARARTFFDVLKIPGARDDGGEIAVAPLLGNWGTGEPMVSFPAGYMRKGRVWMADRKYEVDLVGCDLASSRYDGAATTVRLYRRESKWGFGWLSIGPLKLYSPAEEMQGTLSTMFPVKNSWFSLTTTANCDSVTVHAYAGDVGVVRVSFGGSTSGNYISSGTLHCDTGTDVYVPMEGAVGPVPSKGELRVPVGNYAPEYLGVSLASFYLAARRRYPEGKRNVYSEADCFLKVRKDAPCILDIDSSAEMAWPGFNESAVLRPGDIVSARPMLSTPTVVVSGVFQKPGFKCLYPTVKVEDSAGKTLTESTLRSIYNWRIPPGFVPRGGNETLRMTVTWDTKGLFGVVTGTKEIVVESTDWRSGE
jgi:hypothetical protein